ncbi:MAG: DNA polymerase III subunit delta, partial [Rubrobacteraceae bacterium]
MDEAGSTMGRAPREDRDGLRLLSLAAFFSAFDRFVYALAAGERGTAIKLLEDFISTGEPPLRATFMIRRQFQLLARARAMFEEGAGRSQVASELKVPPFVARKLEEAGRKVTEADAERALESILNLESGLKGGSDLGDELQMELAV